MRHRPLGPARPVGGPDARGPGRHLRQEPRRAPEAAARLPRAARQDRHAHARGARRSRGGRGARRASTSPARSRRSRPTRWRAAFGARPAGRLRAAARGERRARGARARASAGVVDGRARRSWATAPTSRPRAPRVPADLEARAAALARRGAEPRLRGRRRAGRGRRRHRRRRAGGRPRHGRRAARARASASSSSPATTRTSWRAWPRSSASPPEDARGGLTPEAKRDFVAAPHRARPAGAGARW